MKRIICTDCEGEGDFLEVGESGWDYEYVDCDSCRGLGWVPSPEEEEEEDEDEDRD